jgi:hypothetical protein
MTPTVATAGGAADGDRVGVVRRRCAGFTRLAAAAPVALAEPFDKVTAACDAFCLRNRAVSFVEPEPATKKTSSIRAWSGWYGLWITASPTSSPAKEAVG